MFEFMKILTLHVSYECLKGGTLPAYLGSTIRGLMGHCIHEFYCHHRNVKCFLCEERGTCQYVQCFSNTGGEAGAVNPYTIYVYGQGKEKWEIETSINSPSSEACIGQARKSLWIETRTRGR